VEGEAGHERQEHLEVEGQRADHRHGSERYRELGRRPDVAQGRADLPGAARGGADHGGVQSGGIHARERHDGGAEGEGVQPEARSHPERGDQHPGERRSDDASGVHDHAVQAHRVHDPLGADELDDEALARRVVHGVDRAAHEHERVDHPELQGARDGQRPQRGGGHGHRRLGDEEQPALGQPVGEQPAVGPGEEDGDELKRGGQPERDAAAGEAQDEPHLGHRLHPVAGERDDEAREVAAVVGHGERGEGKAQGALMPPPRRAARGWRRPARA